VVFLGLYENVVLLLLHELRLQGLDSKKWECDMIQKQCKLSGCFKLLPLSLHYEISQKYCAENFN
jgi:hypothetical protein